MSVSAMRYDYHLSASDLPVIRDWRSDNASQHEDAVSRRERKMALLNVILDKYEPAFREMAKR